VTILWSYVGKPSTTIPLVGYAEIERDPETNDVKLPFRVIRGPDACVQRLRQKFQFIKGEWFLDRRLGVPFREQILVKNPDRGLVCSIIRRIILDTPGFARVATLTADVDKATRSMAIDFEAVLEDPNVIVRGVNAPFLLR
jgi:hypothetical protein